jgi:hypothetical protein
MSLRRLGQIALCFRKRIFPPRKYFSILADIEAFRPRCGSNFLMMLSCLRAMLTLGEQALSRLALGSKIELNPLRK